MENLLVGLLGGAAGLGLAALMHRALPALLPADFPPQVTIDPANVESLAAAQVERAAL